MNPILPLQHFVPDGEAREMPDGRLYLYGSYDISGDYTYCSEVLHVFSTDDLIHWEDHGVAFSCEDVPWVANGAMLYAPDCIHRDGKYYLYFCLSDGSEGMAVSESPAGPFGDPVRMELNGNDGIDPAVFIDDDGQAYYFWGQFRLMGAKLNPDMATLDMESITTNIIDEQRHGFHEGASVRKYNGKYYLVYTDISRGRATCMSYAVAENPLGPYTKGGVIVDNTGCDPQTWNDHGSIASYKDSWYVFYHRSSQNSKFNRRMCVEPIQFDADGKIAEVTMTTQGVEGPLKASEELEAARACRLGYGAYIYPISEGVEVVGHLAHRAWMAYRYLEFNGETACELVGASATGGGKVEIWADGDLIGVCEIPCTGGWQKWQTMSCEVKPVHGVTALFLVLQGKDAERKVMELKTIRFK